ncbi:MAG: pimeloyl-ACP methyl ester carboxylesterase, partial [Colwellia sp.]
ERYMEIIPNPDVVLLENVAHYPQVEAPERVFSAFTEFHNAQKLK